MVKTNWTFEHVSKAQCILGFGFCCGFLETFELFMVYCYNYFFFNFLLRTSVELWTLLKIKKNILQIRKREEETMKPSVVHQEDSYKRFFKLMGNAILLASIQASIGSVDDISALVLSKARQVI